MLKSMDSPIWRHIGGENHSLEILIKRVLFKVQQELIELIDISDHSSISQFIRSLKTRILKLIILIKWSLKSRPLFIKLQKITKILEKEGEALCSVVSSTKPGVKSQAHSMYKMWDFVTASHALNKREFTSFEMGDLIRDNSSDLPSESLLSLKKDNLVFFENKMADFFNNTKFNSYLGRLKNYPDSLRLVKIDGGVSCFEMLLFPLANLVLVPSELNPQCFIWNLSDFQMVSIGSLNAVPNQKKAFIEGLNFKIASNKSSNLLDSFTQIFKSLLDLKFRLILSTLNSQFVTINKSLFPSFSKSYSLGEFLFIRFWDNHKLIVSSKLTKNKIARNKPDEVYLKIYRKDNKLKRQISPLLSSLSGSKTVALSADLSVLNIIQDALNVYKNVQLCEIFNFLLSSKKSFELYNINFPKSGTLDFEKLSVFGAISFSAKDSATDLDDFNKSFTEKIEKNEDYFSAFSGNTIVDKVELRIRIEILESVFVFVSINSVDGKPEIDFCVNKQNFGVSLSALNKSVKVDYRALFYVLYEIKMQILVSKLKSCFMSNNIAVLNFNPVQYTCDAICCANNFYQKFPKLNKKRLFIRIKHQKYAYFSLHLFNNLVWHIDLVFVHDKELNQFVVPSHFKVNKTTDLFSSFSEHFTTNFIQKSILTQLRAFNVSKQSLWKTIQSASDFKDISRNLTFIKSVEFNSEECNSEIAFGIKLNLPRRISVHGSSDNKTGDFVQKHWVLTQNSAENGMVLGFVGFLHSGIKMEVEALLEVLDLVFTLYNSLQNYTENPKIKKFSELRLYSLNTIKFTFSLSKTRYVELEIRVIYQDNSPHLSITHVHQNIPNLPNLPFFAESLKSNKNNHLFGHYFKNSVILVNAINDFISWRASVSTSADKSCDVSLSCSSATSFALSIKGEYHIDINLEGSDHFDVKAKNKGEIRFDKQKISSESLLNYCKKVYFEFGFENLVDAYNSSDYRQNDRVKSLKWHHNGVLLALLNKREFALTVTEGDSRLSGSEINILNEYLLNSVCVPPFDQSCLKAFIKLIHFPFHALSCLLPLLELQSLLKKSTNLSEKSALIPPFCDDCFDLVHEANLFIRVHLFDSKRARISLPLFVDLVSNTVSFWVTKNSKTAGIKVPVNPLSGLGAEVLGKVSNVDLSKKAVSVLKFFLGQKFSDIGSFVFSLEDASKVQVVMPKLDEVFKEIGLEH